MQIDKLSTRAQAIIRSYTDPLTDSFHTSVTSAGRSSTSAIMLNAWTSAVTGVLPWKTPSREDYLELLEESEYGAW